jgi:hypothetical protein
MIDKEALAINIWQDFIQKITSEWTKYEQHGSFESARYKGNFFEEVVADMKKADPNHRYIVSPSSLRTYFLTDGFPKVVKDKTLQSFTRYLGFETLRSYQLTLEAAQKIAKENPKEPLDKPLISQEIKPTRNYYHIIFLILIPLLILGVYSLFNQDQSIEETIYLANQSQFNAYKNLLQSDTLSLNKYYCKKGTAKSKILGVLAKRTLMDSELQIPPSSFAILETEILEETEEIVKVRTKEYWVLKWLEKTTGKELHYDKVSDQIYFLTKEDGKWKIDSNDYNYKLSKE